MINIPDQIDFKDTGFLYITGGSNHDGSVISSLLVLLLSQYAIILCCSNFLTELGLLIACSTLPICHNALLYIVTLLLVFVLLNKSIVS